MYFFLFRSKTDKDGKPLEKDDKKEKDGKIILINSRGVMKHKSFLAID